MAGVRAPAARDVISQINQETSSVMAGLVPAIYVLLAWNIQDKDADARHEAGHDD